MASDPRDRIETEHIFVTRSPAQEIDGLSLPESYSAGWSTGGIIDWPEVVAFAKAILAADEAWQDSQLGEPLPLEDLQAAHPELLLAIHPLIDGAFRATWESARDGWTEDFKTEKAALRWLAAELAKHGEEMGNG